MQDKTRILHHSQPRMDPGCIRLRLRLARTYVDLTKALTKVAYPTRAPGLTAQTLLVLLGVFIGDGEHRLMSASKLAHFTGLPRATVHRHLEILLKIKKIERVGRSYRYAQDAMIPDPHKNLAKIIDEVCRDLSVRNGH